MVKIISEKEKIYHFIEDIFDDLTEDYGLTAGNAELSTFHEESKPPHPQGYVASIK